MENSGPGENSGDKFNEISQTMEKLQSLVNSGGLEDKEQAFENIIEVFSDILMKYALMLCDNSNHSKAIEVFEKVIVLKPSSIALNNLACCYALKDDIYKAIDACKKALELDEDNIDATSNLAGLYYKSERFDDAITLYEEILTALDNDTESLLLLSNCYFKKGAYESAIVGYQNVLKLDPDNNDAKTNLDASLAALKK